MAHDRHDMRTVTPTRIQTRWLLLACVLQCAALPSALMAQVHDAAPEGGATGNLTGRVSDSAGRPALDAIVDLTAAGGARRSIPTNSAGQFTFINLPAGMYVVRIRQLGYTPHYSVVEVTPDAIAPIEVTLQKTPVQLPGVIIHSSTILSTSGFEHRRQTGAGYYITAEDIAKRQFVDFAGVLSLSPAVFVSRERGGPVVTSTKPNPFTGRYGCASVFIDGRPLAPLALFPEPRDIAGVETYRTNSGPAEFGGSCALVLVWTKDYRGL
jgi:hypothetical protein